MVEGLPANDKAACSMNSSSTPHAQLSLEIMTQTLDTNLKGIFHFWIEVG